MQCNATNQAKQTNKPGKVAYRQTRGSSLLFLLPTNEWKIWPYVLVGYSFPNICFNVSQYEVDGQLRLQQHMTRVETNQPVHIPWMDDGWPLGVQTKLLFSHTSKQHVEFMHALVHHNVTLPCCCTNNRQIMYVRMQRQQHVLYTYCLFVASATTMQCMYYITSSGSCVCIPHCDLSTY